MSKREPTRDEIYDLALRAQVDTRTAKRALTEGVDALRGEVMKERVRAALIQGSRGSYPPAMAARTRAARR